MTHILVFLGWVDGSHDIRTMMMSPAGGQNQDPASPAATDGVSAAGGDPLLPADDLSVPGSAHGGGPVPASPRTSAAPLPAGSEPEFGAPG